MWIQSYYQASQDTAAIFNQIFISVDFGSCFDPDLPHRHNGVCADCQDAEHCAGCIIWDVKQADAIQQYLRLPAQDGKD